MFESYLISLWASLNFVLFNNEETEMIPRWMKIILATCHSLPQEHWVKGTTTFSFLSLTYRDAKVAKFTEAKELQKLEMSLSWKYPNDFQTVIQTWDDTRQKPGRPSLVSWEKVVTSSLNTDSCFLTSFLLTSFPSLHINSLHKSICSIQVQPKESFQKPRFPK